MGVAHEIPQPPSVPACGLTFEVGCRSVAGGPFTPHAVTITPDWRLETPHDLEAERIAIALGGECTCVDVAEAVLPAARGLVTHTHRLAPAEIERSSRHGWRAAIPVERCCADATWKTPAEASAHLRDPAHWAIRFGASIPALSRFFAAAFAGWGLMPRCPAPHAAAESLLVERYGLDALWGAGVHPTLVEQLCRRLSPGGDPVPTGLVLAHAYTSDDDPWLLSFAAHGPLVVAWAARSRIDRDRSHPDERLAWLDAGAPMSAVAALMAAPAYTLADAALLAAHRGLGIGEAARVLGSWCETGTCPPIEALVDLAHRTTLRATPPPAAAVNRARQLAAMAGVDVGAVAAALALMIAGNAPAAARLAARAADPQPELAEGAS